MINSAKKIPYSVKTLFWDMNKEKIDLDLHKKSVIERIINFGNLADWKWLVSFYGKPAVKGVVSSKDKFGRTNIRKSAERLASILFK